VPRPEKVSPLFENQRPVLSDSRLPPTKTGIDPPPRNTRKTTPPQKKVSSPHRKNHQKNSIFLFPHPTVPGFFWALKTKKNPTLFWFSRPRVNPTGQAPGGMWYPHWCGKKPPLCWNGGNKHPIDYIRGGLSCHNERSGFGPTTLGTIVQISFLPVGVWVTTKNLGGPLHLVQHKKPGGFLKDLLPKKQNIQRCPWWGKKKKVGSTPQT